MEATQPRDTWSPQKLEESGRTLFWSLSTFTLGSCCGWVSMEGSAVVPDRRLHVRVQLLRQHADQPAGFLGTCRVLHVYTCLTIAAFLLGLQSTQDITGAKVGGWAFSLHTEAWGPSNSAKCFSQDDGKCISHQSCGMRAGSPPSV